MTIFGTFFQSLIPLEDEKEDQVMRYWIYKEEEDNDEVILATPISPKRYGKGYQLMRKVGYRGPL